MKLELPSSVYSEQDVKALALDVQSYRRWFAHNAIKRQLHVRKTAEQPAISPAAAELIRDWSVKKPLSAQSLDELLAALELFRSSSPSITITLAAPPANNLKKILTSWCRNNLSPNILINFEFNATILGGLVVRCGSRIFDWSFRRQILEARGNFPEVLRHVR